MSIRVFFVAIFVGLVAIFFGFKPLHVDEKTTKEIAQVEVENFVLYELDTKSLQTLMVGKNAKKYEKRYVVKNIDYTDNGEKFIANIKAKNGLYKGDIIDLRGDVHYVREDGLSLETQHIIYDQKTKVAVADTKYILHKNNSVARGTYLMFDSKQDRIKSKNIDVVYNKDSR